MSVKGAVMVPHPPLIIPEVGRGREKGIQSTINAYHQAAKQIAAWRPDTVVVLSPHSVMYGDYFHISPGQSAQGNFGQFGAPQVKIQVSYDTEFVQLLSQQAAAQDLPAGTKGERNPQLDHGTMIPLWFLNQYYTGYQAVRIGLSGLPFSQHYRLGECIQKTAKLLHRNIAVIGSGDLSHKLKPEGPYGFAPEGPDYDRKIMEVMESGQFGKLFDFSEDFCRKAAECGHRSFVILAGTLDRMEVKATPLSQEGPFGVGYGVCVYEAKGKNENRDFLRQYEEKLKAEADTRKQSEDPYVSLARRTVETYVRTGRKMEVPKDLPKEMYSHRAGVFVSLKKEGQLRGCIGTVSPVRKNMAEEIVENAINASTRDPRFRPVEPKELDRLEYSVDVLGEPEEIFSKEELDAKHYGVIVSRGYQRGLLLPNLEGVDTVEEQIAIAKRKAGIPEEVQDVRLERFEVVRHH